MNLKSLSDDVLLQSIESHAREERRSGVQVLWHLREIERRMLYAKLQYGSLFAYAVKHLHYSEGAAMRRIDAMRFLKEMPELETSIESGELSLTNLSLVKQAVKEAKKSMIETKALLEEVKGKTKKECERILAREIPQTIPEERERVLTPAHTEIRVVLNEVQLEKLNRFRALVSHKNPDPTYAELIEMLSDLALIKLDPLEQKGKTEKTTPSPAPTPTPPAESKGETREEKLEWKDQASKPSQSKGLESPSSLSYRKPIPRHLRRTVFQNSGGKCSRCGSTHLLEIDHVIPKARGGADVFTNLRVLCRSCNQYEAMRAFGSVLLRRYLAKLRD